MNGFDCEPIGFVKVLAWMYICLEPRTQRTLQENRVRTVSDLLVRPQPEAPAFWNSADS